MRHLLLLFLLGASSLILAQNGIPIPEMTGSDALVQAFITKHNTKGLNIAITHEGNLAYQRAFGNADQAGIEPLQPYHLGRLASVSKPITAVAIMKLIEDGFINLTDKVFGVGGILEFHPDFQSSLITDSRIYDITVRHLLEHQAGWNRGISCGVPNPTLPYPEDWSNNCEPVNFPLHVTNYLGVPNPVTVENNIMFGLKKGLVFTPDTDHQYSNIGFMILGEIVKTASGISYEKYIKTNIFDPLNACDIHLGKSLLEDTHEREMEYNYGGSYRLSSYGTGINVPQQYGVYNIESNEGSGGLIASTFSLAKLLVAVDGVTTYPDILSSSTINTMNTPCSLNSARVRGWNKAVGGGVTVYFKLGHFNGNYAFVYIRSTGQTVSILLNSDDDCSPFNRSTLESDLYLLARDCINDTQFSSTWPTHDLFLIPSQGSLNLSFTNVTNTSMDLNWVSGNGDKRIIVAKEGSPVDEYPLDGITYTASNVFGSGTDLGGGNFIVYDGLSNSSTLTGLDDNKEYFFKIFDYNLNALTGNHELYRLCETDSYRQFTGPGFELQIKAFLQGPYTSSIMNNNLGSLIPLGEPYGTGNSESITNPSILSVTGNDGIVDWVLLEIRDAINPNVVLVKRAALLQCDGDIVETDGISSIFVKNLNAGNYHIAVKHRNHLGIMTSTSVNLN